MIDSKPKHVIFLLGGPGVGKSTQGQWFSSKFNMRCFATGDVLKGACMESEEKADLFETLACDQKILDYTNSLMRQIRDRQLIDSRITFSILRYSILHTDKQCFLVEGYPRTVEEATLFEDFIKCDCLIYMNSDSDTLRNRCKNRAESQGYEFQTDLFKSRLNTFNSQVSSVLDYYSRQGKLREVDGTRSKDEVCANMLHTIREFWYLPHLEEEPALVPKNQTIKQNCLML